ncbi:hypothetical protein [Paenibacillus elgii]|uniref:hypothetical protein n=1 Tax=Paenibacillus elgii TaxID=189691 RepID=UPI000248D65B|nr:hypothetical protein [Paenibacillus elgii]
MSQPFYINATLSFPLQLEVKTNSKEQALEYFNRILHHEIIDLIEIDVHTNKGKTHIINATEGIRIDIMDIQGEYDL